MSEVCEKSSSHSLTHMNRYYSHPCLSLFPSPPCVRSGWAGQLQPVTQVAMGISALKSCQSIEFHVKSTILKRGMVHNIWEKVEVCFLEYEA